MTTQYWGGLLALCMAAAFAVGLGSLLQHRAIARHQAMSTAYSAEAFSVNELPARTRKASF
jgi:hypothetical protein